MENGNCEQALVERGVNPALAATLTAELGTRAVAQTIDWYDAQKGRVGPGVLVAELRTGGKPDFNARRSASNGQPTRGAVMRAGWIEWAQGHMSSLLVDGELHLGAHAALFRLGIPASELSVKEHGERLRLSVEDWNRRLGPLP